MADSIESMTVKELKDRARDERIPKYYKMRKQELINALRQIAGGELSVDAEQQEAIQTASDELESEITAVALEVADDAFDIAGMNVKQLKAHARKSGISGYSRMRKQELIDMLLAKTVDESVQEIHEEPMVRNAVAESMREVSDLSSKTVKELKATARSRGIKGYSRMRKQELLDLLLEEAVDHVVDDAVEHVAEDIAENVMDIVDAQTDATMDALADAGALDVNVEDETDTEDITVLRPVITERDVYISDVLKELQVSDTDQYLKGIDRQILVCLGMF